MIVWEQQRSTKMLSLVVCIVDPFHSVHCCEMAFPYLLSLLILVLEAKPLSSQILSLMLVWPLNWMLHLNLAVQCAVSYLQVVRKVVERYVKHTMETKCFPCCKCSNLAIVQIERLAVLWMNALTVRTLLHRNQNVLFESYLVNLKPSPRVTRCAARLM